MGIFIEFNHWEFNFEHFSRLAYVINVLSAHYRVFTGKFSLEILGCSPSTNRTLNQRLGVFEDAKGVIFAWAILG
jgi:hypothetical protein